MAWTQLAPAKRPRTAGFDAVRILAAVAIFYQHGCSLLDREDLVEFGGLRVGRLGTSVFFALSGYLAATSSRTPEAWLGRRVWKLFPAFWVVTLLTFFATAVVGYKPFDGWQVVCQLAGIGLFTHGEMLVGVSTWFVSALLSLYLISYLGLRTGGFAVAVAVVVLGFLGFDGVAGSESLRVVATHGVTFLAAYTVGALGRNAWQGFLLWAVALGGLAMFDADFLYGTFSLAGLCLATAYPGECRVGRWFAGYSYEWFLVHGLCLHAMIVLGADELPELLSCAAAASLLSAILLKRSLDGLLVWGNSLALRGTRGDDNTALAPAFR